MTEPGGGTIKVNAANVHNLAATMDDISARMQSVVGRYQAAGFFEPVNYPGMSKPAPVVATPVRLSRTPGKMHRRPPLRSTQPRYR